MWYDSYHRFMAWLRLNPLLKMNAICCVGYCFRVAKNWLQNKRPFYLDETTLKLICFGTFDAAHFPLPNEYTKAKYKFADTCLKLHKSLVFYWSLATCAVKKKYLISCIQLYGMLLGSSRSCFRANKLRDIGSAHRLTYLLIPDPAF